MLQNRTAENAASGIAMVTWSCCRGYSGRGNLGGSVCVVAERYTPLQQMCCTIHPTTCQKKWIGSVLHDGKTFKPLHRPWAPQHTSSQSDRQTDRRHYCNSSQSYCAAVQSAKTKRTFRRQHVRSLIALSMTVAVVGSVDFTPGSTSIRSEKFTFKQVCPAQCTLVFQH